MLLGLEIRGLAGLITMILLTVTLQVLCTPRLSSTGQSLLPRLDPELLLRLQQPLKTSLNKRRLLLRKRSLGRLKEVDRLYKEVKEVK